MLARPDSIYCDGYEILTQTARELASSEQPF